MTAARGIVKILLPPLSSDQGPRHFSSLALSNAARASATFLSQAASNSLRDFASSRRNGGAPGGALSNSSCAKVLLTQRGMLPQCVGRPPSEVDFTCGFHAALSSGPPSTVLRVAAVS